MRNRFPNRRALSLALVLAAEWKAIAALARGGPATLALVPLIAGLGMAAICLADALVKPRNSGARS